jgi:hypothetical protein
MFTNPINPNHSSLLIEQFQRKGYEVRQIKEKDTTLIIFSHEKKTAHSGEGPGLLRNYRTYN